MSIIKDNTLAWFDCLEKTQSFFRVDLDLERMKAAVDSLGLTSDRLAGKKIITVAGTNGKGTTVSLLTSLLQTQGYRVGSYYSPHLFRFHERMQVNAMPIADKILLEHFNKLSSFLLDYQLTYFEFVTLVALDWFSSLALDYLVLEVGLGGRLDAVNVIDPDLAIITNVELDHMQWLGSDRETIAAEKAGIIRAQKPVIFADQTVPAAVIAAASEKKAPLYCYGTAFSATQQNHQHYDIRVDQHTISLDIEKILPEQVASVASAYYLLENQLPSITALQHALSQTLPGRCQSILLEGIRHLLDVAHNEAAMFRLAKKIKSFSASGSTQVVFSALTDKALSAMVACLAPHVDHWYIAPLTTSERAATLDELSAALIENNIDNYSTYDTISQAYDSANLASTAEDLLVITGSFYVLSDLKSILMAAIDHNTMLLQV